FAACGGFGGGGGEGFADGGGGGGWTGGNGGGVRKVGHGAGSHNLGSNQNNVEGANSWHGWVTITWDG
ncbi:MAG: hypothetical protein HN348_35915, partial [Proteobacteria bacterium]|nr:hypothetical protein [Pseudomonadota bacterium]